MIPPVVVGSASRDLTQADPRGWRLGGAAAYAGLTLARLGLRPRVLLGVDRAAETAAELQWLRDAGADLRVHRLPEGPVFTNVDTPTGRAQTCETPGVPIPPGGLPAAWLDTTTWCLVPVADEIDDAWVVLPSPGDLVVVGWQGLLRTLSRDGTVGRRAPVTTALLRRADLVSLSREDVADPSEPALLPMLEPPVTLVVTAGPEGGTAVTLGADGCRRVRAYPAIVADGAVDGTGAGDAFLAGLVAARIGHPLAGSGRRGTDLRLAAALGSLVVEREGLQGVPTMTALAQRMRRSLTMPGPQGA
ncbi:MAG: hypothetical protein HYX54_04990 [Chloroflexi bacterium]|nr:hypothetical protein [Chloroflexota bacterium]